jgi:hypothetical protein
MALRFSVLSVFLCVVGATQALAHDETAGWGGAFKEKVGLTDEQYLSLREYKGQADNHSEALTEAVGAVREMLIADPEADISKQASEINAMLAKHAEEGQDFFREFSEGLSDSQRAKWIDHALKQKRKKSEGKLPKKE